MFIFKRVFFPYGKYLRASFWRPINVNSTPNHPIRICVGKSKHTAMHIYIHINNIEVGGAVWCWSCDVVRGNVATCHSYYVSVYIYIHIYLYKYKQASKSLLVFGFEMRYHDWKRRNKFTCFRFFGSFCNWNLCCMNGVWRRCFTINLFYADLSCTSALRK